MQLRDRRSSGSCRTTGNPTTAGKRCPSGGFFSFSFGTADSGPWPYRSDGLAQKDLGAAGDNEVCQFTDLLITHLCVEALRLLIEVRHANENIWCLAENAPLGVFDERFADTATTKFGRYAEELNVADERALHADHQKAGGFTGHFRQKTLARSIAEQIQAGFVADTQRNPRIRPGHDPRRPFSVGRGLEWLDYGF